MHQEAYDYVARFASDDPLNVVEIGGRDVNGTVRSHFPAASWYAIDAQPGGPEVDEVADGAAWQPPTPVDLVVCTEVFEHTPDWRRIVTNIATMLAPGGRTILTMAGPGRPAHGVNIDDPLCPGWYANIDPDDLADAMHAAGLVAVEVDQQGDDVRATGVAPTDVVITTLFSAVADPQRPGTQFPADSTLLDTLAASLTGHHLVVLHDQLDDVGRPGVTFAQVPTGANPYFQRWESIHQWLTDHPEVGRVWCVDGTDVEMLHDPFPEMIPGVLYVGSEPEIVGLPWLANNHPSVQPFIDSHAELCLLNAGLCGGDRATVMAFIDDLRRMDPGDDMTDMGAFNETAWTRHGARLITGGKVHTRFRAEDRTNPFAWWRHK